MIAFLSWPVKVFMEVRTGRHCVFMLHVHLVFVTKYRKAALTNDMLNSLRAYFEKVCTDFDCVIEEFNGKKIMCTYKRVILTWNHAIVNMILI
jgi:hypothetical protein